MSSGLSPTNSTVVSAFHSALAHQGLVVLVLVALLGAAWNALRLVQLRRSLPIAGAGVGAGVGGGSRGPAYPLAVVGTPEPAARRLLRISFGLLWIFDGILQGQASMPIGLPTQVLQPSSGGSPGWVRDVVNWGVDVWSRHPIPAATSSVWIQVGIGAFLLVAPRGRWSRAAAAISVGWGLVVWAFGESFGGIFAPGVSWLFGAPGAVLFYCVAGALLLLPERVFGSDRLGRLLAGGMGLFFLGMAMLQAWPGRGFWQGSGGTLAGMVGSMSQTPQPAGVASAVHSFGSFQAGHGWAVNLVVVVLLATAGGLLVAGRRRTVLAGVVLATVLAIPVWLLVQDLGFLGGVGTDPNSMVPQLLLVGAAYLAIAHPSVATAPAPAPAPAPAADEVGAAPATAARPGDGPPRGWWEGLLEQPAHMWRSLAALGTIGVILLGAAPMAVASANPDADPIVWQASNGSVTPTDTPAPGFSLVDQHGRTVTLASLRGRAVVLTFLDPVCTSDCPLIAQEMRVADGMLGPAAAHAEFVAVVANPLYRSVAVVDAFDQVENLESLPNWLFLTGSATQLQTVWNDFGLQVVVAPGGQVVDHADLAYVIDPSGRTRFALGTDPGTGSSAEQSSFAGVVAGEVRQVLAPS